MTPREVATEIFLAGIAAVQPDRLVQRHLASLDFTLPPNARLIVVGAGKASAIMAREIEAAFGPRIATGCVVVKYGHACLLQRIQIIEAAHPTPDDNSFRGAAEILRLVQSVRADDVVLCLWSGGASALLADGPPGASSDNIIHLNQSLVRCGADIAEINTVRKHLSQIKGGQLARAAQPARLISLILSDVLGDPLDVIASGPTAPDSSTFHDALHIIKKYRLDSELAPVLLQYLRNGAAGLHPETPKPGDPVFQDISNHIIGNNRTALEACQVKATQFGYDARIASDTLQGDALTAANNIVHAISSVPANTCLLFGGETTVKVTGAGLGGRCQHLALAAALQLADIPGITLLAAGTDGTDGPTDAAGAVNSQTVRDRDLASHYLASFDSYSYLRETNSLLLTGPTFTNVADIVVAIRR